MHVARRILAVASPALAVLMLAAACASADAATISTQACVRSVDPASTKSMPITGTGFTPDSLVTVMYASPLSPAEAYLTSATADATGAFTTTATPPLFDGDNRQLQTFRLSASDDVDPAVIARTTYKQVRVGYVTTPAKGRVDATVTHTVRGFPDGRNTYLHFRFGGVTKTTVKLGRTSAPCGIVSKRLPLLPTKSLPGTWTVYVDQVPVYRPTTKTQLQLKYSFKIKLL